MIDELPDPQNVPDPPNEPDPDPDPQVFDFNFSLETIARASQIELRMESSAPTGFSIANNFYVIEKRNVDGINWDVLYTSATGVLSEVYLHPGLSPSETVEFQVKSEAEITDDATSETQTIKKFIIKSETTLAPQADTTPPTITIEAFPGTDYVELHVSADELVTLEIQQETSPLVFTKVREHTTLTTFERFTISGLSAATDYTFRVIASDTADPANTTQVDKTVRTAAVVGVTKAKQIARDPHTLFFEHPTTGEAVPVGFFDDGSPWILGPILAKSWTPAPVIGTKDSAMLNPKAGTLAQGFGKMQDSGTRNSYRADLDLATRLPLVINEGTIVVSRYETLGRPSKPGRPEFSDVTYFTVVPEIPPEGSLRPAPWAGSSKRASINKSSIDLTRIPRYTPVPSLPAFAGQVDRFSRPWFEMSHTWQARSFHPWNNFAGDYKGTGDGNGYGQSLCGLFSEGALSTTRTDITDTERRDLAANLCQIGFDWFELMKQAYGYAWNMWLNNGGHSSGRLFAILYAGHVLRRQDILEARWTYPITGFGETQQTFRVSNSDVGRNLVPDPRAQKQLYDSGMVGMPEWGITHFTKPIQDNAHPTATYRGCCTGIVWAVQTLLSRDMGIKPYWGIDAADSNGDSLDYFDYVDRYTSIVSPNPGWPQLRGNMGASWMDFHEAWMREFWDTHRASAAT